MTTKTMLTELHCQNCQSQHTATNAHYRLLAFARWLEAEHHVSDLEAVTVQHILAYKGYLAKSGLAPASQAWYLHVGPQGRAAMGSTVMSNPLVA